MPFFLPLWYLSALFSGGFKSHHVVHDSLSDRDFSTSLFNNWPAEVRGMASTQKDFRALGRVRPSRQSFTNDDPTVNGKLLVLLYLSRSCVFYFTPIHSTGDGLRGETDNEEQRETH
jgi:hypothetical protein